jgi:hypothetical protein
MEMTRTNHRRKSADAYCLVIHAPSGMVLEHGDASHNF